MDILNNIKRFTKEDVSVVKVTPEDMIKIHPSLTLSNPMTFKLFLSKRKDLTEEEKDIYMQIIERLEHNDRMQYSVAMKDMLDCNFPSLREVD